MSIPKSSIYTAIEELVEKNVIGISIGSGGRRKLCLLGKIDMKKILEEKIDLINRLAGISLLLISSLIRRYVDTKTPVKTLVPWLNTQFTRVLEELSRILQDIARGKHRGTKELYRKNQG